VLLLLRLLFHSDTGLVWKKQVLGVVPKLVLVLVI